MTEKKKIFLSSPHMSEENYEMKYIQEAFDSNWIAPLGANVNEFENEMCRYTGAKEAVAMTTGTGAIHMGLRYLGVGKGDVVFCSSMTFAASCNPIMYENATPVFIDSEPGSWNMSPVALEKAFLKYPNPKAVVVVNLYGQSADYDKILEICNRYNVPVLEDAAESLGGTYKGKQTGTFGEIGIFSFNGNKIITTSGGGMLVCDDKNTRDKVLKWITQSREPARHYEHTDLGFNYRMSNICAGIGRGQLKVLNDRIAMKKYIYNTYKRELDGIGLMMPICDYGEPNYWLSCMTIETKKPIDLMIALENENIESRPIWKPMHLQPYYKGFDYFKHDEDICSDIFNKGICLPSDPKLTDNDLDRIIDIIRKNIK